jgi:hypothetical protein
VLNTCPLCARQFVPSVFDDYMVPACGCFDEAEAGAYPCENCGINHAWNCPKLPGHDERVAATTEPKIIEFGPIGPVFKGRATQKGGRS